MSAKMKTSATWTKGPLEVSESTANPHGHEVRSVRKGSVVLAQFWSPPCDRSDRLEADAVDQERDANAGLYAAAPELADALVILCEQVRQNFPEDSDTTPRLLRALESARAALRKAGAL